MIHKGVAALYILCAAVQYNDPDFYVWIPLYLMVALVALAYGRGWRNDKITLAICAVYALGMVMYIPDAISWIQDGTPSITGSMKAESPFIEFVREFFGLAICLLGVCIYWRLMKSNYRPSS